MFYQFSFLAAKITKKHLSCLVEKIGNTQPCVIQRCIARILYVVLHICSLVRTVKDRMIESLAYGTILNFHKLYLELTDVT